jgi:hypothetical protein
MLCWDNHTVAVELMRHAFNGDRSVAKRKSARVGTYTQKSIMGRIEALFLDNIGRVVTRAQIIQVAKDPETGAEPENWHQRLSELRTNMGYTILSSRDTKELGLSEYLMPDTQKRIVAGKRVKISQKTWSEVLKRAGNTCEWDDGGLKCGLKEGDTDPIGGGTVKLTADHKRPHSVDPKVDPDDSQAWQALCGRHQVVKKNFWDHSTGKLNVYAIVQAAPQEVKREIYDFLKKYFGE